MFQEGDIVEIPLPDDRMAIAWILHISKQFKGAVGFIVFGIKGQVRDDVVSEFGSVKPTSMMVLGPLYTHMDAIKHYGWKTFAQQPISESQRMLTKREVGGGVYVGEMALCRCRPFIVSTHAHRLRRSCFRSSIQSSRSSGRMRTCPPTRNPRAPGHSPRLLWVYNVFRGTFSSLAVS